MTGNEVQELVEMERNGVWEEINKDDPAKKEMENAAKEIMLALDSIDVACYRLIDAQGEVLGYPMEDMIGSFYEDLITVSRSLKELAEKYEKGER